MYGVRHFFQIYETSSCERGILGLYFVGKNTGKSKLYTGLHESKLFVYCVYLQLADCFVSSPSQNIFKSSFFSPVKRRNIVCSGEDGKQNINCIVFYSHECMCEILYPRFTVGCQMPTLYCGGGRLQKYFLYNQMSIQCVVCAFTVLYLLLVARNL